MLAQSRHLQIPTDSSATSPRAGGLGRQPQRYGLVEPETHYSLSEDECREVTSYTYLRLAIEVLSSSISAFFSAIVPEMEDDLVDCVASSALRLSRSVAVVESCAVTLSRADSETFNAARVSA